MVTEYLGTFLKGSCSEGQPRSVELRYLKRQPEFKAGAAMSLLSRIMIFLAVFETHVTVCYFGGIPSKIALPRKKGRTVHNPGGVMCHMSWLTLFAAMGGCTMCIL